MNTINMEGGLFGAKNEVVSAVDERKVQPQRTPLVKSETLEQMDALVKLVKLAPKEKASNDQQIQLIKNQVQNNEYHLDVYSLVGHLAQELSV